MWMVPLDGGSYPVSIPDMPKTLICCSIPVDHEDDVELGLERARRAAADGARLVEWRIDALAEGPEPLEHVRRLLEESPLPAIITCRGAEEGGAHEGEVVDRVALLEAIGMGDARPRYIDFELAEYRRSANIRQKIELVVDHEHQVRDLDIGLILSTHDFEGRPGDLMRRIAELSEADACSVGKVVWQARSLRDNLEVFDLLKDRTKPMIALCMGEFGVMSRVLAPKFGGFLTFATLDSGEETAPGQPTIRELRALHRFDSIGPDTRVYGIAGWPVDASWSPLVHNAGFEQVGFDGVYLHLPIPPEWEHFKATIGAFIDHQGLDFSGMSVTMPHKEHLVRFVREAGGTLDEVSTMCGAANTLVVDEDRSLRALNTDAPAAIDSLVEAMGIERSGLADRKVAVLGAGGVARAVVAGLIMAGAEVTVVNRTRDRADRLVSDLSAHRPDARLTVLDAGDLHSGAFDAFVNCTSVGSPTGSDPDASPLPDDVELDESTTVLDTIYAPEATPLVRDAASRGARVATGDSMFIRQAALQFRAWTGTDVPEGLFEQVLQAH
jgi:3-dehydroquinate dehydratase/shikimate dehydrogenase